MDLLKNKGYLLQWMLTKLSTFKPEGMTVLLKEYTVQECPLSSVKSKLNLEGKSEAIILFFQKDKQHAI